MSDSSTIIKEAYRLSERRLEMLLTSAIAADQRAVSIAGLTATAAAVLGGFASAAAVPCAMLLGAFCLVIAALFAWYSARPQQFYAPGAEFADLAEDIEHGRPLEDVLTQLGGFNDKHCRDNLREMKRSSRLMHFAFRLAIFGLSVALLPQLLALAGTK